MAGVSYGVRRALVVLSAVLAVSGVVVAATGSADKPGKLLAGGVTASTTTSTPLGSSTPSTGTPTSIGRAVATTVKPGTVTTTTRKGSAPPSAGQPAAASCTVTASPASADPGPAKPPAPGNYSYVAQGTGEAAKDCSPQTVKIEAGQDGAGVVRRTKSTANEQGTSRDFEAWSATEMRQEKIARQSSNGNPAQNLECDWKPDALVYPLPLQMNKTWNVDSACDTTAGGIPIHIHLQGTGKVTGRATELVGTIQAIVWVIEGNVKVTVSSGTQTVQSQDITLLAHFEPTHGIETYDKSTTQTGSSTTTAEQRLLSLSPS